MSQTSPDRSAFRVVGDEPTGESTKRFCGHCGRQPAEEDQAAESRVCSKCGMGLLLEASADVAPAQGDPFLVVDSALRVCAVSRQAERLLGMTETEAVDKKISDYFAAADSEAEGSGLVNALVWAARGDGSLQNLVIRPTNTFGVRYWARIGRCGPPQAALLVLADAR